VTVADGPRRPASAALDRLFGGGPVGRTDAVVVMRRGDTIVERYGPGVTATTTLRSWSMAKSMLHAVVGMLVDEGRLAMDEPAPVPEWRGETDQRGAITLAMLMRMRSGLAWVEDPGDGGGRSDVVDMLYGDAGTPHRDTAAFAAAAPLADPPGTRFDYSSGTSAIVSRLVGDVIAGSAAAERAAIDGPARAAVVGEFLERRLFGPLGMTSATPKCDRSGNWMASSFCFCTATDFARFGQLYLDGGRCGSGRLLSERWVATASIETGRDDQGRIHTSHWWRFVDEPWSAFHASGWRGQYIVVVPEADLVVVRLGETLDDRGEVESSIRELIEQFG
jgi:CubicO group peptidase (beta-lactamase class C family)